MKNLKLCFQAFSQDKLNVKVENLKTDSISAMILLSEREDVLWICWKHISMMETLNLFMQTQLLKKLYLKRNNKLVKELEELKNISGKEERNRTYLPTYIRPGSYGTKTPYIRTDDSFYREKQHYFGKTR